MATATKRIADMLHWQTAYPGVMLAGTSDVPLNIRTDANPPMRFYFTSADTTGAVRAMDLGLTLTVAATSSQVETLRVLLTSNVKTGTWANAIYAKIDYSTSGAAHGMAASVCAEMIPPNSSLARGALYSLDLEFGCGASSSWGSAGPVAFIKFENWGTATYFSANAFLFHLAGETGAAGALLGANSNTLKVRIGTTTEYLVLSEYEDTLSIGLTGAKKTLVTGVPEIAIWSTSALTSGTQDVMKIDYTHTAIATSGYVKGLRVTMTSNVRTPGSFNAVKGIIDYQTSGSAHGDAACVAAELTVPNSSLARGALYGMEIQISCGASSSWGSAGPVAFMKFGALGTVTEMDLRGYLFDIQGLAEGSNKLVDNDGDTPTATGGIRCRVGTTDIWLLYRDSAPA